MSLPLLLELLLRLDPIVLEYYAIYLNMALRQKKNEIFLPPLITLSIET